MNRNNNVPNLPSSASNVLRQVLSSEPNKFNKNVGDRSSIDTFNTTPSAPPLEVSGFPIIQRPTSYVEPNTFILLQRQTLVILK
jgi:hypothetical protein